MIKHPLTGWLYSFILRFPVVVDILARGNARGSEHGGKKAKRKKAGICLESPQSTLSNLNHETQGSITPLKTGSRNQVNNYECLRKIGLFH